MTSPLIATASATRSKSDPQAVRGCFGRRWLQSSRQCLQQHSLFGSVLTWWPLAHLCTAGISCDQCQHRLDRWHPGRSLPPLLTSATSQMPTCLCPSNSGCWSAGTPPSLGSCFPKLFGKVATSLFSLQMTGSYLQTHTRTQPLAAFDMQTQMQALTAVHIAQKLQCIKVFWVTSNLHKDFLSQISWILSNWKKLQSFLAIVFARCVGAQHAWLQPLWKVSQSPNNDNVHTAKHKEAQSMWNSSQTQICCRSSVNSVAS